MGKYKPTKYDNYTKEQLIAKLQKLEKQRYGLVWEDKPEEVAKQCETELPILAEVKDKAINKKPDGPTHYIIEGDNYHSLYTLNFTHRRKIDFIYIDPPYNTGSSDWKYNNNYVDQNDRFRHSKWLSFMSKRLRLAKNLIRPDGVICVTIDDYEMPRLLILLESIFGYHNHLGTVVIRNNPKGRMTKRKFSLIHEYGLFFGRGENSYIKKLPENPKDKTHNYKKDVDGSWYLPVNLRKQGVDSTAINKKGEYSERYYPIYYDPKTEKLSTEIVLPVEILPIDSKGKERIWRRAKDDIEPMFENGDIWYNETKNGPQLYFKFRGGLDGKLAQSVWMDAQCSASDYGTKILDEILGEREKFQYPKAPYAVKQSILSATDKKDAIILDFFAGSGTTGQAVLELNNEDGGTRQFILCTNDENNICDEVTYPRIRNLIQGYSFTGQKKQVIYKKKLNKNNVYKTVEKKEGESEEEFTYRQTAERTQELIKIWKRIDAELLTSITRFDKVETKFEDSTITLVGYTDIKSKTEGIPANVKYFKNESVPAIKTDNDKRVLVAKSTELLCLAEDTFDVVKQNKQKKDFAIFQSASKLTAIIYDEDSIVKCVAELNKLNTEKETVIYVFSYDHTYAEEDFYSLKKPFVVKPIPEAILNVYRKAQKISKK